MRLKKLFGKQGGSKAGSSVAKESVHDDAHHACTGGYVGQLFAWTSVLPIAFEVPKHVAEIACCAHSAPPAGVHDCIEEDSARLKPMARQLHCKICRHGRVVMEG